MCIFHKSAFAPHLDKRKKIWYNAERQELKILKRSHKIIKAAVIAVSAVIILELAMSIVLVFFSVGAYDGMENIPDAKRILTPEAEAAITRNNAVLAEKTEEWLVSAGISQVSITAQDGAALHADLLDGSGHDWVILLHGYKRTRERTYNYGRLWSEHGFGVLMPDMRGHGMSGGSFIGMGWLDRKDVAEWAEFIISRDPEARIVLHGISMGAAAAMMTAGDELPGNVRAVVEDCGYTSVWDEFSDVMRSYTGLPDFPLMYTTSFAAKLIAGYSFDEASSLEQVKKSPLPILFIHGSADTFVKPYMAEKLCEAHPNGKLILVEGAEHGQAMYIDPEAYFAAVFGFIEEYIA